MSDLISILTSGASALAAQQQAAATASHNLQNANTPGYARQRVELQAVLPAERVSGGYIGRGVSVQTITQARDRFLEAQLPAQLGLAANASAKASVLDGVSALDPDTNGIASALSGFYTALRALGQNPADASLRSAAVAAARTLASAFNTTRSSLEEARSGVDAKLTGDVDEVNDLTRQVALYNRDIRAARAGGAGEPNDLLDARQKAVDRLAELTGATPVGTSEGDVSLFMPGGTALVTGITAGTMSVIADPANGGHLALRFAQPGQAALPVSTAGGELGGLLEARDSTLGTSVNDLDTLAWDLAASVNTAHAAGYGLDGVTGRALFDAGLTPAGAAGALQLNAAILADPSRLAASSSAAGLPGNAGALQALIATEGQALASGRTAAQSVAKLTSDFGAASRSADAASSLHASLADHLQTMRESVSGVSVDEELINLQKAQRGYEAIAKVIQASSDLFDTLLQLK
ncbi:MAG: flagellar hook-associated protein FlgK [Anaeromyxobacter sp.]